MPRLLDGGHSVRCMARRPGSIEGRWEGVEVVEGEDDEAMGRLADLVGDAAERVDARLVAGEVVEILVQNGEAVEFGQPLVVIDPA